MTVRLGGELVTCYLFAFRLSYSGKAVHRIFASAGQEAFFEGHVHALNVLGGVLSVYSRKCSGRYGGTCPVNSTIQGCSGSIEAVAREGL
ncbi:hypothetical protein ACFYNW_38650 [Streptomyces virginiae]|uniref:hypothetical protein n=1 Tax=Streptomyces virginiae TaxID=1961 RepID=UPI0036F0DFA2